MSNSKYKKLLCNMEKGMYSVTFKVLPKVPDDIRLKGELKPLLDYSVLIVWLKDY